MSDSKKNQHWLDSDNPRKMQQGAFGAMTFWVIGIIALSAIIGAVFWGARVATSDKKGAGDAQIIKNSAKVRIAQQERFEQMKADFDGYLVNIKTAEQAVSDAKAAGDTVNLPLRQTELIGMRQQCVNTAQDFNANSRKYTARNWKSAGLPEKLDPNNCSQG